MEENTFQKANKPKAYPFTLTAGAERELKHQQSSQKLTRVMKYQDVGLQKC